MKQLIRKNKIAISAHILFWCIDILILKQFLIFSENNILIKNGRKIVQAAPEPAGMTSWFIIMIVFKIIFCYLIIYKIGQKQFYKERKAATFFLLITIVLFALEQFISWLIVPSYSPKYPGFFYSLLKTSAFLYLLHGLYVLLFIAIKQWTKNEKQKTLLREEKHKVEIQFLKSQLDPHFLFNTLNNLYSLALDMPDSGFASSILKLSDFMRYIVYRGNEEKVLLSDEIFCIKNYIDLQKLKFAENDEVNIALSVKGQSENKFVYPLLLLGLVENAFKHGFKAGSPFYVRIQIDASTKLVCTIENYNYCKTNKTDKDNGLGLVNLKRRLELLYPNQYELAFTNNEKLFQALLIIDTL